MSKIVLKPTFQWNAPLSIASSLLDEYTDRELRFWGFTIGQAGIGIVVSVPRTLRVYENENEWVIAYSEKDAIKVLRDLYGSDWEDYGDENPFYPKHPETTFTLVLDDEIDMPDPMPAGAIVEPREFGGFTVKATHAAWVKSNGRGLLGSVEW